MGKYAIKSAWVISICFLYVLHLNAQKEEILIKQFVHDLYDTKIPEETIVKQYLVKLEYEKGFTVSLEERNENQLAHIKIIRKLMLEDGSKSFWMIPGKINADPDNSVAKYLEYKDLDEFDFYERKTKQITKNMYVLLDKDRNKILQYFLMEKGKIKYFTLFVQSGHASFFGF